MSSRRHRKWERRKKNNNEGGTGKPNRDSEQEFLVDVCQSVAVIFIHSGHTYVYRDLMTSFRVTAWTGLRFESGEQKQQLGMEWIKDVGMTL